MPKRIKYLKAKSGDIHKIGAEFESPYSRTVMVCESITHRTDGQSGIYKDKSIKEAHYEILYMDPVNDKLTEMIVVPQDMLETLIYVVESSKTKDSEADVVMKQC